MRCLEARRLGRLKTGRTYHPLAFQGRLKQRVEVIGLSLLVSDIPVPEDFPIFDLSLGDYGEWTIESDGGTLDEFTITDPA